MAYLLPGVLAIISLACILWPYWSMGQAQQEMVLNRVEITLPGQGEEITTLWGPYQLLIEQDQTIAWGEAAQIHLLLNPLADTLNESQRGNFVMETRVEFAGVEVSPQGVVNQPLTAVGQREYYWFLEPYEQGEAQGTLWVYLNLVPSGDVSQPQFEPVRRAILAKPVKIIAFGLLGLSSGQVRQIGMLGLSAAGLIVILMFFGNCSGSPAS